MIRAIATGMLVFAASVSASTSHQSLSISEVAARHEKLDGHRVRVHGWLNSCQRLGCIIYESPGGNGATLSLGSSPYFDRRVASFAKFDSEIILEGIVDRHCFDHSSDPGHDPNDILVCTDRADQIRNPRLVRVVKKILLSEPEYK
jgi:hypothetical protein